MNQPQAQLLLERMLGPGAAFREGQWEAIDLVANHRQRLLVVQRTGWGKSMVYFLVTKILRDVGAGPTLLISPLLALMRNQVLAAERLGLRALTLNSTNVQQWDEIANALRNNECDLLLVSPERLGNPQFLTGILRLFQPEVGLLVVDEAHCISDWGHDFRPDYRRIVRVLRMLPPAVPVLCTTATANNRVVADVVAQIPEIHVSRGPLIRHSLRLYNVTLPGQADRLAWLARFVPELPGSGIIYTLTIEDARRVAAWLRQNDISAEAYHSEVERRPELEQKLLDNKVKALVATVALGMGFDKPDLGFVIHFQRPGSVVAYYQQVGRAGRAVDKAFGILLSGREDDEISDYFIRTAFPPAETISAILELLDRRGKMELEEIAAELNRPRAVIEKALKLLDVEGAVEMDGWKAHRNGVEWQSDVLRSSEITARRYSELDEMRRYVQHDGCLMEFLGRALDDPAPQRCGKCMNCVRKTSRQAPPPDLVRRAGEFLRQDAFVITPHLRWPKPLLERIHEAVPAAVEPFRTGGLKSTIPEAVQAIEGRALCSYGDAGWGCEVARGKYDTGTFSDELVNAAAELIEMTWKPEPRPTWVTWIPSLHRPALVQTFAERLAARLGIECRGVLVKQRTARPQKEMQCSTTQLGNVLEAFRVRNDGAASNALTRLAASVGSVLGMKAVLAAGPVLLVDDVIDSGWTLTWAAVLLRAHGSGPVYPFALAKASPRGR